MDFRSLFIDKDKIVMANMELGVALNSLDEAIVLNQLNYWIERNKDANRNFRDGHYWVYNSYEAWRKQDFPVWSATKIKRIFTSLEWKGIVLSANYNKLAIDKTKWYTIDYDKLKKFIEKYSKGQNETPKDQDEISKDTDDQPIGQNDQTLDQSERALPETTTDTSTEITNRDLHTDTTSNSFSTEKDIQSNSPEGGQSNSFSGEKKSAASNQTKRHSEKEMEDMVNQIPLRARRIAYEMTGDTDKATRVYECIDYFLGKHKENSRERHKVLKDETLRKIVFKFIEGIEIERDGYTDVYDGLASISEFVGDYQDVIDEYFNTDFKEKCDYSLVHFSSDTVLTNMMNHVCKEEWCESV